MTKTKYEVFLNKQKQYSCVTTTRNLEDMVELLKDKFSYSVGRVLSIYKIDDKESVLVYKSPRTYIKKH